jgi:hypothetical protein
MSKTLLGRHLFLTCGLSWPKDGIYRVLRRINRESKSQYISDVQRVARQYKGKNGERKFDWDNYEDFKLISRRFRKNLLFDGKGNLTDKYGDATIVDKYDYSEMYSDTPFEELFRVVKGNSRDDLFQHDLKTFSSKIGMFGKIKNKTNKKGFILQDVCVDSEGYIGQHLSEVFKVDVYVADRIWCDKRFVGEQYCGHNYSFNYSRDCDFDRNAVFHQVTSSGGDKTIISKEDNQKNSPVFIWFFKDRIVYTKAGGRSEH